MFIPSKDKKALDTSKRKVEDYEIKLDMVTPDVVRMNMASFRKSKVVKQQIKSASNICIKHGDEDAQTNNHSGS